MTKAPVRMTAADLPDREMGAIEMRGGYFCGERTRVPAKDAHVTITRSINKHRQVVCNEYHDSGDRIIEQGAIIRIFRHVVAASWSHKERKD